VLPVVLRETGNASGYSSNTFSARAQPDPLGYVEAAFEVDEYLGAEVDVERLGGARSSTSP